MGPFQRLHSSLLHIVLNKRYMGGQARARLQESGRPWDFSPVALYCLVACLSSKSTCTPGGIWWQARQDKGTEYTQNILLGASILLED